MSPFILIAGLIVGGVVVVIGTRRAAQERVAALRAIAERLGWGFREEVPFDTIPRLDRFELFTQGRSRRIRNVMTSPAGGPRAVLFDYMYVTGGGKSQQTHRQTVFYGVSETLHLPTFSLRPQHFGHSIAKAFGYQDIDPVEQPVFSDMFVLRGDDEARVREVFSASGTAEFFIARSDCCAAVVDREVLFWRAGKRVAAENVETLMSEGFDLVQRLEQGGGAGGPGAPFSASRA